MDARKLEDVDVSFVSLVKRGANRIPFRIIKSQEEDMSLDLGSLFRAKKAEAPQVLAVVLDSESINTDTVRKLEEKGYARQESEVGATSVVFKQEDYASDSAVVDMGEGCAVVLSTVKKSFYSYPDGTNFDDNLAKGSFFPSVDMAQDILEETIANIMYDSGVAVQAKTQTLGEAVDSFKQYVLALSEKLPASAFELASYIRMEPDSQDAVEVSVEASVEVAKDEDAVTDVPKEEDMVTKMDKHQGTIEGLEEESEAEVIEKSVDAPVEDPQVQKEESSETAVDESSKELMSTVTKMAGMLQDLQGKIDTLTQGNTSLVEQVEKAEATAASALEAVQGSVIASVKGVDESVEITKSESVSTYDGTALDALG